MAARNGIMAALLACRGFGGPHGVFDGAKYNIFDAFSGMMNLREIARDLGDDFAITRHDGFKKYPCCNDIHSGLDALLEILAEHKVERQQIATITHKVKEDRRPIIDNNPLKSHNAQYIMAIAAVERKLKWDDFLQDRRLEPEIGEMYGRTRLVGAEELAESPHHEPAIVEVRTTDGQVFTKQVDAARGHSANPMTESELQKKFMSLARPIVGGARARELVEMIGSLDTLSDVRDLVRHLA
jgi:2-methylcitrate dehydratase PrpD